MKQGLTWIPVIVESPYAGDITRNAGYLNAALRDCLTRGEAPFASHGLYTREGVLNDQSPIERELGIDAGFSWRQFAAYTVFYIDHGWSAGMRLAEQHCKELARNIHTRMLIREHIRVGNHAYPITTAEDIEVACYALSKTGLPLTAVWRGTHKTTDSFIL